MQKTTELASPDVAQAIAALAAAITRVGVGVEYELKYLREAVERLAQEVNDRV